MRKPILKNIIPKITAIIILLFLALKLLQFGFDTASYKLKLDPHQLQTLNAHCLELITSLSNSAEQRLIDIDVLMTTVRFMLEERNEEDVELVAFVRKLLVWPQLIKNINLSSVNHRVAIKDFSQHGQSKLIDEALGSKRGGFFIEAGAYDGEFLSNSLFFELERAWTGLLIEPMPSLFQKLVNKNRNAYAINACLANNRRPLVAKYRLGDALSGRNAQMNEAHLRRIANMTSLRGEERFIYVPCFSLRTILRAIGVDRVDYFSLDVEGGEVDVLRSIDFETVEIRALTVEHNQMDRAKAEILDVMMSKGYKLLKQDDLDFYFLK